MSLPAIPPDRAPVPATVTAVRSAFAYPATPPPPPTLEETIHTAMAALAAAAELAGNYRRLSPDGQAVRYPCQVCGEELVHRQEWERRQHFDAHPLMARVRVQGWKAVVR